MKINNVIIHELIKEQHKPASKSLRESELDSSNKNVEKLIVDILGLYDKIPSKSYGKFEKDNAAYPTPSIFHSVFQKREISFLTASIKLMDVLQSTSTLVPFATGGFIVMAHVTNENNTDLFVVAMVNNVVGNAIDKNTFDVLETVHVELQNLRVAGKVNLTDWIAGDEDKRYINFLKYKGDKVSDYFKNFLGCNNDIVASKETKKLVDAVKLYAHTEKLDEQSEADFYRRVNDYCRHCADQNDVLSLEGLSNAAWPDEPKKLSDYFAAGKIEISSDFIPDKRSLKSLIKIHGKTPFWSVNIDRQAFGSGNAKYDPKEKALILYNLPNKLREDLIRETSNDEE